MYFVNIFTVMLWSVKGRGRKATPTLFLTRRNGNLAAIACQHDALACGKTGVALFLHHHNGVAVVFADFELDALGFVH